MTWGGRRGRRGEGSPLFFWSLVGRSGRRRFQNSISTGSCGSCGSWKECDSEYYHLKEEEMKLYQKSKILGSHFYSAWIPIQKRKWIKQWVLGCNFSDKVLHFRYGLQSPAAKGSFKKNSLGICQVSPRPSWVFWCGNLSLLKCPPCSSPLWHFPSTINWSWGDNKNIE